MASALATVFLNIRGNTAGLATDLKKAQKIVKRFGRVVGNVGRTITTGFSLPVAAIGLLSIREFANVEKAFVGVSKTVTGTAAQFKVLEKSIIQMSKTLPFTATEIAKVAQVSGQLGVEIDGLREFTKTMLDMGVAFDDLTAEEAAIGVAKLLNSMGEGLENARELGNVVTILGNNMAATEAEIISMTRFMAPAGKSLGLVSGEVAALSAALVAVGINAQAGGSSMSRIFLEMGDAAILGGKKLEAFADVAGTSMKEFAVLVKKEPVKAITLFIDGMTKLKASGQSVTPSLEALGLANIRVKNTLNAISGGAEQATKAFGLIGRAQEGAGALANEANKFYATFHSLLVTLGANIRDVGRQIGEILAPAVKALRDGIVDLTDSFTDLNPKVKTFLVYFTAFMAISGPLLIAIAAIAGTIYLLTTPIGLFVAAVLLIGAAISAVAALFVVFKDDIGAVIDDLKYKWQAFAEFFPKTAKFITGWGVVAKTVFNAIIFLVKELFKWLVKIGKFILNNLIPTFDAIPVVGPAIKRLGEAFQAVNVRAAQLKKTVEKTQAAMEAFVEATRPGLITLIGKFKEYKAIVIEVALAHIGLGKAAKKAGDAVVKLTDEQIAHGKKLAAVVDRIRKQYEDLNRTVEKNSLKKALEEAATAGKTVEFDIIKKKLEEVFFKGTTSGIDKALKSQGATDAARDLARRMAELAGEAAIKAGKDANTEIADDLLVKQKKAYKDSIDTWRSLFQNAITGTTFDLKDALTNIAVGFAAEFAAGISRGLAKSSTGTGGGFLGGIINIFTSGGGAQDIGGLIAQSIGGELIGQLSNVGTGALGTLATTYLTSTAPATASVFTASGATFATAAEATAAGQVAIGSGVGSSASSGLGAMGAVAWPLLAAAAVAAVVHFTKGKTDPRERGRKQTENWIEDLLKANAETQGGLRLFDKGGDFRPFGDDFRTEDVVQFRKEGVTVPGQFENVDGPTALSNLTGGDADAIQLFGAMGEAFRQFGGIVEEIGGEIAIALAVNLGGSLDNAKLLIEGMGLEVKDLEEALVAAGNKGAISWQEVAIGLQGLGKLAKEGLVGIGDIDGAFKQLVHSGGRGSVAIQALRNIATEAMQAGVDTLDQLEAHLLETGNFTNEQITGIMSGLSSNGIASMEELDKASDTTLQNIVANMDSKMQEIGGSFDDLGEDAEKFLKTFEQISEDIKDLENVRISIEAKIHTIYTSTGTAPQSALGNAKGAMFMGRDLMALAKGGVVSKPTLFGYGASQLGLMGEAGPEAILPLKRGRSGILGVEVMGSGGQGSGKNGNLVIHIDARGAAPGVEHGIRNALLSMKDQAVNESISAVRDMMRRGA